MIDLYLQWMELQHKKILEILRGDKSNFGKSFLRWLTFVWWKFISEVNNDQQFAFFDLSLTEICYDVMMTWWEMWLIVFDVSIKYDEDGMSCTPASNYYC